MKKELAIGKFTCKVKELQGCVGHFDGLFGISWYCGNLETVARAGTTPALCCAWQAPAFATPEGGRWWDSAIWCHDECKCKWGQREVDTVMEKLSSGCWSCKSLLHRKLFITQMDLCSLVMGCLKSGSCYSTEAAPFWQSWDLITRIGFGSQLSLLCLHLLEDH